MILLYQFRDFITLELDSIHFMVKLGYILILELKNHFSSPPVHRNVALPYNGLSLLGLVKLFHQQSYRMANTPTLPTPEAKHATSNTLPEFCL